MRWEVGTPRGTTEALIADEWEIHESGALIFWTCDGPFKEFVVAYAQGAWLTFWQLDA